MNNLIWNNKNLEKNNEEFDQEWLKYSKDFLIYIQNEINNNARKFINDETEKIKFEIFENFTNNFNTICIQFKDKLNECNYILKKFIIINA